MKLRLASSIFLFTLTIPAFADPAPASAALIDPGKVYVGVFGGGGSSNRFKASQYGTAFFIESAGGPLAVNAFGNLKSQSAAFFGIQLGYQAQGILLTPSSQWTLGPAVELEGYAMGSSSFKGSLNNDTDRIDEHDFLVSFPMNRTVYLANAVVNFNNPCFLFHPYVGVGVGNAIIKITGASAAQINPVEPGINHFNTNTSDSNSAFAGQVKVGLSYDINQYLSLFAEYRWLYIASTKFVFGSTVNPIHVQTTSWQVNLGPQQYNMGDIGLRLKW